VSLSLPPGLVEALRSLAGRLPFLKMGMARKAKGAEPFAFIEDETPGNDSLSEPNAVPASALRAASRGEAPDFKGILATLLANRLFVLVSIGVLCLGLALAVAALIAGAPPEPVAPTAVIAPGGKDAVRGLIPPRRAEEELDARVELERPEGAVYTAEEAERILSETRSRAADLDISGLAAENDREAERLYESVP
jgi:hypothetical protein